MKSIRTLLTPLNIIESIIFLIVIFISFVNGFSDIINIHEKAKIAAYASVLSSILIIIEGIRIVKRGKYKVLGYIVLFLGFYLGITVLLDLVLDII